MRALTTLLLLLLTVGTVHAGTLELTNGAVIPGTFKRIEHGKIIWTAELIGDIKVEPKAIAKLDSPVADPLRVGTTDLPDDCAVRGNADDVTVSCTDRPPIDAKWDQIGKAGRLREGTGKITTAMTVERGNSFSDEFEVDARANWRRNRLRHQLEGSVDYEEKRSGTTEDEASLDYQLDYVLRDNWYVYGRTEYHRDRFGSFQEGLLGGIGIGRTWTFFTDLQVLLQAGPDYGRFDIQEKGRVTESGGNVQWRLDHDLEVWKLDLTLFHEGEYAWVIRDSDLNRIETKSGVELPLLFGVLAELRLDYDRIGANIPGVDDADIEWVLSLGYKW